MINEITVNSSNAIDMSRGELLNWVNELMKTNLTKIEQLGTGAVYCQLTDVLYPGKLPLSKVNWKAKFEYQFVANFKVLQQSFTKLGINKHIDVQKLIKCKYQDNLQFLQWFRKIFEINAQAGKDYNALNRRGDQELQKLERIDRRREKENKTYQGSSMQRSNSKTFIEMTERSMAGDSFIASDRTDNEYVLRQSDNKVNAAIDNHQISSDNFIGSESEWKNQMKYLAFQEEREFYLKKFKEIQHLCEEWKTERQSSELIGQLRKIMLVAPNVDWSIQQGEYVEHQCEEQEEREPVPPPELQ